MATPSRKRRTNSGRRSTARKSPNSKRNAPIRSAKSKRGADSFGQISVFGLSWLGLSVENVDEMSHFLGGTLGLHCVHRCDGDHVIFKADNGDFIALYGPRADRYGLFTTGPVVGLRVSNIVAAKALMENRGIAFIGSIHSRENGKWKYAHFRGPDQRIYELVEESAWPESSPEEE
jgi:catechol 2,3-dioxygenase-like lactoylglutathione lyase family enzyme